jgi:acetolactate synthase regulatory subunit
MEPTELPERQLAPATRVLYSSPWNIIGIEQTSPVCPCGRAVLQPGLQIESLSVAATDDPSLSRITLVTKGSAAVIHQIINQLNKLIDVVAVDDMTATITWNGNCPREATAIRPKEAVRPRGGGRRVLSEGRLPHRGMTSGPNQCIRPRPGAWGLRDGAAALELSRQNAYCM